jgi:hypothetical protein
MIVRDENLAPVPLFSAQRPYYLKKDNLATTRFESRKRHVKDEKSSSSWLRQYNTKEIALFFSYTKCGNVSFGVYSKTVVMPLKGIKTQVLARISAASKVHKEVAMKKFQIRWQIVSYNTETSTTPLTV